jgi:antitoxin component of MazEF toxin-antitoxin module
MKVRLQKIGSTMYVRLPLDYVRLYNLREVQMVDLKEDENGSLVISAEVR